MLQWFVVFLRVQSVVAVFAQKLCPPRPPSQLPNCMGRTISKSQWLEDKLRLMGKIRDNPEKAPQENGTIKPLMGYKPVHIVHNIAFTASTIYLVIIFPPSSFRKGSCQQLLSCLTSAAPPQFVDRKGAGTCSDPSDRTAKTICRRINKSQHIPEYRKRNGATAAWSGIPWQHIWAILIRYIISGSGGTDEP